MLNSLGAIQHSLLKGDLNICWSRSMHVREGEFLSSKIDTYVSIGIRRGLEFVGWIGFEMIES
jgi:hypothetical protein